jgi:YD repeat-containing protein
MNRQTVLRPIQRLVVAASLLLGLPCTALAEACWQPISSAGRIQPWETGRLCQPTAEAAFNAWIAIASASDRGCFTGYDGYCFHYTKRWTGMTGAPARSDLPGKCEEPAAPAVGSSVYCLYFEDGWTDKFGSTTGGPPGAWFAVRANAVCPGGQAFDSQAGICRRLEESSVVGTAPPSCDAGGLAVGNPIQPLTGTKRQRWNLGMDLPHFPLTLTFDSSTRPPMVDASRIDPLAEPPQVLGTPFLALSTHRLLRFNDGRTRARVFTGDGYSTEYLRGTDGQLRSSDGSRLAPHGAGWLAWDSQRFAVDVYSGEGRLLSVSRASGATVSMAYSADNSLTADLPKPGLLAYAQDDFGRRVNFSYQSLTGGITGVSKVTGPDGSSVGLAYDALQRMDRVTFADLTTFKLVYGESRLPFHLTGVIDERGKAFGKFPYLISGQVAETSADGAIGRYQVTQQTLPAVEAKQEVATDGTLRRTWRWIAGGAVSIESPTGGVSVVSPLLSDGWLRVSSQTQPAGSGCAASSRSLSYDSTGNPVEENDFNGNRVCRGWDASRRLEMSRVEGLATDAVCSTVTAIGATLPAGARKVSSQWHPDWRLSVKVAEPLKFTTKVYNGQPDPFDGGAPASCAPSTALLPDGKPIAVLCKEVEQATTDASGAAGFSATLASGVVARQRSWTYNQWGQVLTAKGPRTDVNDTTTYAYHLATTADVTMGDLQSVTNAAGQVTSYTHYNRHGQALRLVDPNGVLTVNTYDLRQRLKSATVGGRETVFSYDAAGLLKQLSLPDGTSVGYTWDDAQRLTKITDQAGNSVTYTLDNAGNRAQEVVTDSSGNLSRTITRAFDALGRLQQVTGAAR